MMTSTGHTAPRMNGPEKHSTAFLFAGTSFGGGAGRSSFLTRGNGSSHSGGTAGGRNSDERRPGFPGINGTGNGARGPPSGRELGDPDDNGDSRYNNRGDDNSGDNPSGDGHPFLFGSGPRWAPVDNTPKKQGAKLPYLHPRQFSWNGERAKLRPYIQKWYDHLQGFQDYAALIFLQRYVPTV